VDDVTSTLIPVAVLVVIAIVGMLGLRRFSDKIRITFDGISFVAISLYFERQGIFPIFPPLDVHPESGDLWLRVIGGGWWLLGSRLLVGILWLVLHRDRRSREARLFSDLSAAAIYIATGMVVLNSVFSLPITGVVATSGVVAIVLGLALQNTLADVFSGIAVGIEAPFGVGDRVQIGDKVEGQVVQVNWRSIRIQTDGHDVAIIPNSLVAKAEIINRSFPSQRRAAAVEISCPESALPERVIETLLHATLLCPDILQSPPPGAVVIQLGPKRNLYKISFFVESTKQLAPTKDLLLRGARRQLHYAGFFDTDHESKTAKLNVTGDAINARRLLQDLVLFECLSARDVDALTARLQARRLEPGEVLFKQGAADASLHIVASGVLEFVRQTDAGSETIGCIGAGEYVGEIGLLTGAAHAATATARTYCQVYHLPHDALSPLLEQNTELSAAFDKSVRRGLDILHREVAARASPYIGGPGQLLVHIRSFFRRGPA
jgi:small-conductance mechanosensitive channel/CRP-like cAMP-binding protein